MASIFKPTYTKKDPKTGKKVTRKLKKWYVKYRDAEGIVRRVAGFTDKSATLQLAAKLERQAEHEKMGIVDPFDKHRQRPLVQHVDEFEASLRSKSNTEEHIRNKMDRLRAIVKFCKFAFISDISASGVEEFLTDLRAKGRSLQIRGVATTGRRT